MKSIKKKAEELYRIPRGDDTEDTVALDLEKDTLLDNIVESIIWLNDNNYFEL